MSGHGARPTPVEVLRSAVALALVVGAWIALERLGLVRGHGGPLFALGFLVIVGTVGGVVAGFVGLPRLVGYLIAGLLAGPAGVGFIDPKEVKALSLINALALALISLQAGAELTVPVLRRTWRSVGFSAVAQVLLIIPLMALVFWLARPLIPFTHDLSASATLGLAVVWGTLAFVRSPAVTLAVIGELRAKGPLTDWSLGVVVALDVLILPLFAAALGVARTQVLGEAFDPSDLLAIGHELFASFAAGISFGLLVGVLFRWISSERVLLVVVLAYAVTALTGYLHYDTLFVFMVAGCVASNLTRAGPALIATTETTSSVVMIVFFATAGAKLDLAALIELWPVVLLLFAARAALTWLSVGLGHRLARDPPVVRKNGWLVLVSQAGVAIGLATLAADALPGIGRALASLVVAVVALNEVLGATLTKLALARAGEARGAGTSVP